MRITHAGSDTMATLVLLILILVTYTTHCITGVSPSEVFPVNCVAAYRMGLNTSGIQTLQTADGESQFEVYCLFINESTGYVFPGKAAVSSVTNLDLTLLYSDKSNVMVLQRRTDGRTSQTILRQLPAFSDLGLTALHNSWESFTEPQLTSTLGSDYIFVGFLDKKTYLNNVETTLGLESNGKNATYLACDQNPNSYANFYVASPGNAEPECDRGLEYALASALLSSFTRAQYPEVMESEDFRFVLEVHFGGCGWFYKSQCPEINGYAIGLPFSLLPEKGSSTGDNSGENNHSVSLTATLTLPVIAALSLLHTMAFHV